MAPMKLSTCLIALGFVFFLVKKSSAFVPPSSRHLLFHARSPAVLSAASLTSTADENVPKQILKFQEPKTNVTVVLVGSMHYNPSSIQLAESTISELAAADNLGSVIVESCDIRWNTTLALYERRPWLKRLLKNEMVASSDLAQSYQRPVILGDQRINLTTDSIKECFQDSVKDLVTPPSGWGRFASDVSQAADVTGFFGGEGYLNAFAFLDPKLLLAFPVSLVKYPLSFLVRDPLPTSILFLGLFGLNYLGSNGALGEGMSSAMYDAMQTNEVPLSDWIVSLTLSFLETVFFARAFLKPLLAERNEILAKSILDQCQLLSSRNAPATRQEPIPVFSFPWPFGGDKRESQQLESSSPSLSMPFSPETESGIVYASGDSAAVVRENAGDDQTVVAVLGMAHCNGIKKLLQEELI